MTRAHLSTRRALLALILAAPLAGCGETAATKDPTRVEAIDALNEVGAVPKLLRIGVTPSSGAKTADRLAPLFAFLAKKLKIEVVGETAASYDDLARMINEQQVEIGIFSPLAYVKAVNARPPLDAVPIATATRRGSPTYHGYLVVKIDPNKELPLLASLKGKRIAWVHKSSTSGYLYPRAMLEALGHGNPDAFFAPDPLFAGNHHASLAALLDGKVDVAAAGSPFVDPDNAAAIERADELFVVAKTARIPHDCVVVHKRLQRRLGKNVRDALLELHHDRETSEALDQSWGLGGFVRPMSYDEISKLALR